MDFEQRQRDFRDSVHGLKQQYPNQSIETIYIEKRKYYHKVISEKFPVLYRHIFGKKYLLPQYRIPDYHRAEACDYLMLDSFFGFLEGHFPEEDHVSTHCMSNYIEQLNYGKPTFWLEKELGFPLLKTKLPLDFYAEEINWRWPAFRVYLPKGLLCMTKAFEGKPVTSHVMFLDICHVQKHSVLHLPKGVDEELTKVFGPPVKYTIPLRVSNYEGLCISAFFDFDAPESAIAYTVNTPLEEKTIQALIQELMDEKAEIPSPYKLDETDIDFNNRMTAFTINILMYLSALPLEYDPAHDKALRQPKVEGRRLVPGLYHARFIGQSQIRPKQSELAHANSTGTGHPQEAQWRCGHWRKVWFGPGKTQWRRQWIGLYHTKDIELERK